jgi:CheY-like chemotaxis protein
MASSILIVDDNEVALAIITEGLRLRMNDVKIDAATSLGQALSKASDQDFDVIVVNTLMARMDGVIVLAALHRLCPEAAVLTIALSAYCPQTECEVKASEIEELEDLLRMTLRKVQHFIPVTQRPFHWAS